MSSLHSFNFVSLETKFMTCDSFICRPIIKLSFRQFVSPTVGTERGRCEPTTAAAAAAAARVLSAPWIGGHFLCLSPRREQASETAHQVLPQG